MTDAITPEIFEYLVTLAALELTPDEGQYLRQQLNNQLKAIAELERLPIADDVPPAAHGVTYRPGLRPALRDDVHRPSDRAAAILAQAPEVEDGYLVVPDIPHTELD
jgi:aspartyl-tRNA(Asn)/glutamyl-tRNA(Gln) amidotransferase subunit C